MSEVARVIFDGAGAGSWNMAVDQVLLMSAENQNQVTLRFYGWSEPTLSLGYFQKHQDRENHPGSADCPLVRRRSGGGAIVHDNELTYSLALPSTNRWSKQNGQLYDLIHDQIIGVLAKWGLTANLYRDLKQGDELEVAGGANKDFEDDQREETREPFVSRDAFLCFQRRTDGDIVMGGFKVVGSAQRRLKHSLLQHGSLLLDRSPCATELPGIFDLGERGDFSRDDFTRALTNRFEAKLNFKFDSCGLDEQEKGLASEIEETVFRQSMWNQKR
jgi:lipoate-protein ligase A